MLWPDMRSSNGNHALRAIRESIQPSPSVADAHVFAGTPLRRAALSRTGVIKSRPALDWTEPSTSFTNGFR
jgi:hypothetical protein